MTARSRLFRKYAAVLILLVGGVLLLSSLVNLYFSYRETKAALVRLERQQALAAASRIEQFVTGIERQVRAAMEVPFNDAAMAREQREIDFLRLLRDVPALSEIVQLDATGKVQLLVSRFAPNEIGSQRDLSRDPRFMKTRIGRTYFGPVYFRNESEPYLTIAVPWGEGAPEVVAAEVDLKAIWHVISQIKVGVTGYAYVIDQRGLLVAHPDMSVVLQKRDLSGLPQIRATRDAPAARDVVTETAGLQGGRVLTSHAAIEQLGWLVFAEQPLAEAFAPLQGAIVLSTIFFVAGLGLSVLASVVLARRMVAPIRVLQEGAARIGAGELGHRIDVRTGDELETLGEEFNRTAAHLEESYATLEQKVDARTRELADANAGLSEALEQQTATSEVLKVISRSTFDLEPVLRTLIENAAQLCGAARGHIFRFDGESLRFAASYGATGEFVEWLERNPVLLGPGSVAGRAASERRTVHVRDVLVEPGYEMLDLQRLQEYRTALAVPMLRGDVLVGVITILKTTAEPFTQRSIELVTTFADQAVIAIENVRLFKELEARTAELTRSVEELRALGEVGRAVSGSLDIQSVLTSIVSHAVELSQTDAGTIYEFDEATQVFVPQASYGMTEELIETLRQSHIGIGESGIGQAAATRAAVQIPDIESQANYPLRFLVEAGYRALLAVPLLREDRVIGGLVVRRKAPGIFQKPIVDLLQTFATQSVIAIQNARLFREIDEKSRALEELSRNQKQLSRLSTALQEPLSLAEQLTRVLDAARQVVGLDHLYIWTPSPAADGFIVSAGAGLSESDWRDLVGVTIPLGEAGALAAVYRDGEPLLFSEAHPLPEKYRLRLPYSAIAALRLKAFLVSPMIARGRTVGVLSADNRVSRAPIPAHTVDLLHTFAAQAAVAVENARLFQEIQEKSQQLEAASQHKSEFLANMSHELRTPLNAILGFNEMILGEVYGDVPTDLKEPLTDIQNSGKHLLRLINNVLDLAKIEAGRMELTPTDYVVQDTVERVRASLHPLAVDKGLEFVASVSEDIPLAYGDAGRITQCLMNLAGNALKFTRHGRVGISVDLQDGLLLYRVTDTGIGIAKDRIDAVFAEFRQGDARITSEFGGTGLGLSITKKFVEMHGGRIWVESELGKGSTFFLAVPLRLAGGETV